MSHCRKILSLVNNPVNTLLSPNVRLHDIFAGDEERKEKIMGNEMVSPPRTRQANLKLNFSLFQYPKLYVKTNACHFTSYSKDSKLHCSLFLQCAIPFSTSVSIRPWGRQSRFIFSTLKIFILCINNHNVNIEEEKLCPI